jgi:Prokaryotic Cytochrome C oxidase subunit IV
MDSNLDEQMLAKKKEAYRRGIAVIILLIFLTAGEYWLGSVAYDWWAIILAIAVLKAFFVVRDYMHIGRLFAAEEEASS